MELSVVIPVFNEAACIRQLLDETRAQLEGQVHYEVIVVDDGSTDSTAAVLADCRRELPRLRVLHHRQCYGQSAALASGINAARAPWVATLDGDGQNDPADIMKLYQAMEQSPGDVMMIAGARRQRHDSWLRRVSSRVANRVRAALLGDDTFDTGCGLKLLPRAVFLSLPQFSHMHRFLPALVQRQGGEVKSVDVNHRPRQLGSSKYGVMNRLWVGIIDLFGVWWLKRRALRPIVDEVNGP
ncbi:MAG: glycosyltransferase family 2 protein [Gammaproteobacteria bacterium]|nr:glycosyltransferase family 2 protein [Gammaproteobacteria bacterium]